MTYAEAKKNFDDSKAKYDAAVKQYDELHKNDNDYDFNGFRKYMLPYTQECRKNRAIMIPLIDNYKLEDRDNIGDYMPMKSFIESCECGGFIDYDGFGYLCIGDKQTDISIIPSVLMEGADVSKFDGVMWYNK